jgi:hypothetical protein
MSDDETRPIDPEAPMPPEGGTPPHAGAMPAYAMPVPPHGYAGYGGYAAPRPRFADQVIGMRAVVAVALACLIIGGLSGFILGHAAARDGRFGRGPVVFQRPFPDGPGGSNGFPEQPPSPNSR